MLLPWAPAPLGGQHCAFQVAGKVRGELGARKIGIEIKFSAAPKPTKGFWQSLQDLAITRAIKHCYWHVEMPTGEAANLPRASVQVDGNKACFEDARVAPPQEASR